MSTLNCDARDAERNFGIEFSRLSRMALLGIASAGFFGCSGIPVTAGCEATGVAGAAGASSCDAGPQGTGGATQNRECERSSECKLIDDCCTCEAVPSSEAAPLCLISTCFASACTRFAVSNVSCIAGRCVLATSCDESKVTCNSVKPACAAGELAQVVNACWTGACVKASDCPTAGI